LIRFQADADVDLDIVLAVRRREPAIDFASAADSALHGLPDSQVLEIAARSNRILLTHDRRTMPGHFQDRLALGGDSPGVFIVSQFEPIGLVTEVLVMVWAASDLAEWHNQIWHLPGLTKHLFGRRR
jgi:hypothetical protein